MQIGNPSDWSIILKTNTIVGTISPVTAVSPRAASAIMHNHSESSQARIDLTASLDETFKNLAFNDQQKTQLLDLCTRYRSVFSLNQEELGRRTIAKAEFPLQKNTKPVDRHPYRTNPRAQDVIDKCVENMESAGIFYYYFYLTYSRWTSSLPSCLWSLRIFPSLPGSRLTNFERDCKLSTLTTRQPMVEIHLLTFPRFPLRKKEHKSYIGKNQTHDFRTSRCAGYLLDHSGDGV